MTVSRLPNNDGGVQPTILTAKGDLLTATAASTLTNLAVGSDGMTLVANSSAATGLQWQAVAPLANPVLNSAMQVWQRYFQVPTSTITAATSGATTAYVVTNYFVVGQYVTVTGMTPTTLNGAGVVTIASGTGFTISATTTGTFSAGGVATGSPYVAVAANTPTYTADRWCATGQAANTALTVSRQATSDTTNLPSILYCGRVQRNSGQTGTGTVLFTNNFENINSTPFVGKTVTYSFYARAGANFSATSNTLNGILISGTGTDQNRTSTGWTGETNVASSTATLTTTWQRFTATGTVASTATQLGVYFSYAPTGTASTNDYFEVTGVQIDIGSVALPFRTNGGTYQAELQACRRYLPAVFGGEFYGYCYSTNNYVIGIPFDTQARVAPTGITVIGLPSIYDALNTVRTATMSFNSAGNINIGSLLGASTGVAGTPGRMSLPTSGILFTGCEL